MKHDILTVNEESLSIEVVGGVVNSSRNKNITKKGVRLFENNKICRNKILLYKLCL